MCVCGYVRMCVCVKTILGLSSASMVVAAAAAALAEENVAAQVICLQEEAANCAGGRSDLMWVATSKSRICYNSWVPLSSEMWLHSDTLI